MAADLFLLVCALLFGLGFRQLFRHLPEERWQFVASLPLKKNGDGSWQGLNLTFYGLFTGLAGGFGVATFILLTAAAGVALITAVLLTLGVLAICLPAAKIIATVVEKNRHGFTVGGASFVGIIIAPIFLWLADQASQHWWNTPLPTLPMLAAMSIAYVMGEGIGRLAACISFGCCYGKALNDSPVWAQRMFATLNHVFIGKTKKIAFAGEMEAVKVIPIQAVTCVLYTALALLCSALFFHQLFALAFALSLVGSQLWRVYSETLRADYRGGSKLFSVYQLMALLAALYGVAISIALPAHSDLQPLLSAGLAALWTPEVILCLQLITVIMFFFSGTSTITTGELHDSGWPPTGEARPAATTIITSMTAKTWDSRQAPLPWAPPCVDLHQRHGLDLGIDVGTGKQGKLPGRTPGDPGQNALSGQGKLNQALPWSNLTQPHHPGRQDIKNTAIARSTQTQAYIPGGNAQPHRFTGNQSLLHWQPQRGIAHRNALKMILTGIVRHLPSQQRGCVGPLGQHPVQPRQLLTGRPLGRHPAPLHQPDLIRQA